MIGFEMVLECSVEPLLTAYLLIMLHKGFCTLLILIFVIAELCEWEFTLFMLFFSCKWLLEFPTFTLVYSV